jgi:predicted dehydrogenase
MKKIKIGVVGIGRGRSMIEYAKKAGNAELVAICDFYVEGLIKLKEEFNDSKITYYEHFDDFLKHDMDAVVLANYATEHAPFAIKAMKAGFHVLSEVLPVQTLKEAVELVEAVESTHKIYAYAENYCYMPATREMRKLYRSGKLGLFEYGEGEYIHNCLDIWPDITYGDPNHWRNHMYATFYATHSIGPLIHITGLKPVKVTGFELPYGSRAALMGKLSGTAGIEMIELENGAIIKSIHGDLSKNSIWYSIYGTKGRVESAREDTLQKDIERVYVNLDYDEHTLDGTPNTYEPKDDHDDLAHAFGHGGSDFYTMYHFVEKLLGNPNAITIDIYEALDMFLPGLYAYRSILQGGIPIQIPDLRQKETRDALRHDTQCTDPKVAGKDLLPCYSKGNPVVDPKVYEDMKKAWEKKNQSS